MSIKSFKPTLISLVIASVFSSTLSTIAFADEAPKDASVDEQFTILGTSTAVNNIPGSAHQLTQEDLENSIIPTLCVL